jgi:phage shock protein A
VSNFDLGYRDPLWARLEEKDTEIAQLKKSFEQTSLIAEQLFEKQLAEKDAEIERLKQYACQCEASVHSTQNWYAELQAEIERLKANRMSPFSTDELRLIAGGLCKMFIGLVPNCRLLDDVNSEVDRRNYELRKAAE